MNPESGFRDFSPSQPIKKYLHELYGKAVSHNLQNITSLLDQNPKAHYLDLGCDNGDLTLQWAKKLGTSNISGVEIVEARIQVAQSRGINVKKADLNSLIPLENNSLDVITGNQVIEHLHESDRFLEEISRVLKPGGYVILSTENSSSWCNIFASLLGWQIFSLTNFSKKQLGLGNPLALHRGTIEEQGSWTHQRIYSPRALREYLAAFGLQTEALRGAGYFPLPTWLANWDTTHSHFITIKARKS